MPVDATVKGAAFDVGGTQNLRSSIAKKSPEGVKEAARQFESLLTYSMLKSMRNTVPKEGMFHSQAEEMYMGLFDQQLADDIAHTQNGLGLAKVIEQQLGRQMGVDMNNAQKVAQNDNLANVNANTDANINTNVNVNASVENKVPSQAQNNENLATIVRSVNHQKEFQSPTQNVKNNSQNLVENNQNVNPNNVDEQTQDQMMRALVIQAISGLIKGETNFNEFKQNINQININSGKSNSAIIDNDQQFVHILNLSAVNENVNFQPGNNDLYNASAATLLAAIEMQQQKNQQKQQNLQNQQNQQNSTAIPNRLNLPMATSNLRHIPVAAKTPTSATYAKMGIYPTAKTQKSLQRVTENIDLSSLTNLSETAKDFVKKVWNDAQKASQSTGIDANYLIAHAALESGWGQSQPGGRDNPSYNLFGIKANKAWNGRSVGALTTEYIDGIAVKKIERFRAYNSYAEAFEDYANFLKNNPRYAKVLQATSASEFANGLQKAGYATDPEYANKLKTIMKNTNLDNQNSNIANITNTTNKG